MLDEYMNDSGDWKGCLALLESLGSEFDLLFVWIHRQSRYLRK